MLGDAQQKETIDTVRHMTAQYLRIVGSSRRLLDYAAGTSRSSRGFQLVADGLFTWWDTFVNPADPDLAKIFSHRELEALRSYDAIIRGFHETSPDRHMPIHVFVNTSKYQEISDAARHCHKAFKRFWFFRTA